MAVEVRRLGSVAASPLSFRRSLNPYPCPCRRVSFQLPSNIYHRTRRLTAFAVIKKSPKRLKYSAPRFTKEDGILYVEVDPLGSDSWKLDPVVELLKGGAVGVIPTDTVYAIVCDLRNNAAIERLRRIKDIDPSKASCNYALIPILDISVALKSHLLKYPFFFFFFVLPNRQLQFMHLSLFPLVPKNLCFPRILMSMSLLQPLSILCHSFKDIDTYTTGFPRGNGQGLTNIFRAVKHCLPGPYTFILTASKELPKQCIRYGATASKYAARKNVGIRMPDDAVCQAILEKMESPLISTSVKSPKENEWILDPVLIADAYGPEGLDFVVAAGTRVADPSTVVDMTGSCPRIVRLGKGPKQPWMVAEDEDSAVND